MAPATARSAAGGRRLTVNLAVWGGSALLVWSGALHFYLWHSLGYDNIPTIGPLFAAQAISCGILALATAAWRKLLLVLAAAGLAVSSIGGLLVSVQWGLFGWQESLSAPYVGMALWVEAGAAILLGMAAALIGGPWLADHREQAPHSDRPPTMTGPPR